MGQSFFDLYSKIIPKRKTETFYHRIIFHRFFGIITENVGAALGAPRGVR
jgi:hypothetical protein